MRAGPPGTEPWIPPLTGFPIKNVGNDREGKTGMTEGDIGNCHSEPTAVIPSVARNLVVSTTECLEKQILRFAQDDR